MPWLSRAKTAVVSSLVLALGIYALFFLRSWLFSEIAYEQAQRYVAAYRWDKAQQKFEHACAIDPLNAQNLAGYGDFLMRKSQHTDHPQADLEQARRLYVRALALNRSHAGYALTLGRIELALSRITSAFSYFADALRKDPQGFSISYAIGYVALAAWPELDSTQKEFVLKRLKFSLGIQPWLVYDIYPRLWKATGDFKLLQYVTPPKAAAHAMLLDFVREHNLWQFRKEQSERVQFYRAQEKPLITAEEADRVREKIERLKAALGTHASEASVILPVRWHGIADDGTHKFVDGAMYWTGTMYAVIGVPAGNIVIAIQARGDSADGIYPYMLITFDGQEIGEVFVASSEWKEYTFTTNAKGGNAVIGITFLNDGGDVGRHEDRNLYIGETKVVAHAS